MCGIVAQHGRADATDLDEALDRLAHRGPDDRGVVRLGDGWLGHRRLSIVDLEGGHQPLRTRDGRACLVGNGEVYNHRELRAELGDADLVTGSDNEVALHLLLREGPAALARLNGMFAFVLATEDGGFVAARDPIGIKPLYWSRRDGAVRFASEMRAFPRAWQAAVEPFPPGCAWTPGEGLVRFASPLPAPGPAPGGDLRAGTRAALVHAVERQLMGDVPVGVFLSGGLDSSLVAAIAVRAAPYRVATFAVGTPGSPDLEAAREVAAHLGTDHHERSYDAEEALSVLPEVVRTIEAFDPGLVRSAVPNLLLARLAARHVKVVLTGEGADELFAGYAYLRDLDGDPAALHAELERTVAGLHGLNLQRCDRVTMAHGLEARVPFLDREVVDWALRLPAGAKAGTPEKRLLREAFDGWLPEHLLWRTKAEFGDGSGARDVLSDAVGAEVTDAAFAAERHAADPPLRTKEEVAYFRLWRAHLAEVDPARTLGRWVAA